MLNTKHNKTRERQEPWLQTETDHRNW